MQSPSLPNSTTDRQAESIESSHAAGRAQPRTSADTTGARGTSDSRIPDISATFHLLCQPWDCR
eukprot:3648884-Pyramimonas_sp.AAC.1